MEDTPSSNTVSHNHPGKGLWHRMYERGMFPAMGTPDKDASFNLPGSGEQDGYAQGEALVTGHVKRRNQISWREGAACAKARGHKGENCLRGNEMTCSVAGHASQGESVKRLLWRGRWE